MTERATSQAATDDQELTVYIARDGAEIGECWRGDVAQLVAEGELLRSDYYWHEGMENWERLEQLLARPPEKPPVLQATQRMQIAPPPGATEPAASAPEIAAHEAPQGTSASSLTQARDAHRVTPQSKSSLIIAGAICGAFIVAAVVAILVIRLGHDSTPVRPQLPAAASASTAVLTPEKLLEQRDKAAAELRAKLEALPAKPEPPLHTFYYDVAVNLRRGVSPRAQWEATIRGSENVVAGETEQPIRRTEFTLVTEYRGGHWAFKQYKSSTRNLDKPGQSEDEHDERTQTPPPLVSMLGLKIEPAEGEQR